MTAVSIDGKAFSEQLVSHITSKVSDLKNVHNIVPGLAVILVGEDAASEVYVRNKGKRTIQSGMRSIEHRLDATTTQADLLALIVKMNADDSIDGILVQLPLPKQINSAAVIQAIEPEKDVDGFHVVNAGLLATGQDALVPCTPYGCLMLLLEHVGDLTGKHVVILGRSNIVGKPMVQLMLAANATVTIVHSRTSEIPSVCREADIVIAAIGKPEMVRGNWLKKGAVVIDVGINRVPAPERGEGKFRLTGDVHYGEAEHVASAITPVPGGVGPMTIACLLRNTLVAACRRRGIAFDI